MLSPLERKALEQLQEHLSIARSMLKDVAAPPIPGTELTKRVEDILRVVSGALVELNDAIDWTDAMAFQDDEGAS